MSFEPRPTRPNGPLSIFTALLGGANSFLQARRQNELADQQKKVLKQQQSDLNQQDQDRKDAAAREKREPYAATLDRMADTLADPAAARQYRQRAADIRSGKIDPEKFTDQEQPGITFGGQPTPPSPAGPGPTSLPGSSLSADLLSSLRGGGPAQAPGLGAPVGLPAAGRAAEGGAPSLDASPDFGVMLKARMSAPVEQPQHHLHDGLQRSFEAPRVASDPQGNPTVAGGPPNLDWQVNVPPTQTLFSGLPQAKTKEEARQGALREQAKTLAATRVRIAQVKALQRVLEADQSPEAQRQRDWLGYYEQVYGPELFQEPEAKAFADQFVPEAHVDIDTLLKHYGVGHQQVLKEMKGNADLDFGTAPSNGAPPAGPSVAALPSTARTPVEAQEQALADQDPTTATPRYAADAVGDLAQQGTARGPLFQAPNGVRPGLHPELRRGTSPTQPTANPGTANPLVGDLSDPLRRAFIEGIGLPLHLQPAQVDQSSLPRIAGTHQELELGPEARGIQIRPFNSNGSIGPDAGKPNETPPSAAAAKVGSLEGSLEPRVGEMPFGAVPLPGSPNDTKLRPQPNPNARSAGHLEPGPHPNAPAVRSYSNVPPSAARSAGSGSEATGAQSAERAGGRPSPVYTLGKPLDWVYEGRKLNREFFGAVKQRVQNNDEQAVYRLFGKARRAEADAYIDLARRYLAEGAGER